MTNEASDGPAAGPVTKTRKKQFYADPGRKPTVLAPNFDMIPDELKKHARWVLWRLEPVEPKDGRPPDRAWDKPLYQPNGRHAKSNTPKTWSTFEQVKAAYLRGGFDGIGFTLGDEWVGVDLDDVRNPETGELVPWAAELVAKAGGYVDPSPSGTGVKVIGRGRWAEHLTHKKGHPSGVGEVEVYTKQYFTVTGQGEPAPVADLQPVLDELAPLFVKEKREKGPGKAATKPKADDGRRPEDDEVLAKALVAANGDKFARLWAGDTAGYPSASEADQALANQLVWWCCGDTVQADRLFRRSKLIRPEKWDAKHYADGDTYGQRTLNNAADLVGTDGYDPNHRTPIDVTLTFNGEMISGPASSERSKESSDIKCQMTGENVEPSPVPHATDSDPGSATDQGAAESPKPDAEPTAPPEPAEPAEPVDVVELPRAWNNPLRLAEQVREGVCLLSLRKTWFQYAGGRYVEASDRWVESVVRATCEKAAAAEFLRAEAAKSARRQKLQRVQSRLNELDEGNATAGVREHLEAEQHELAKQVKKDMQSAGGVPPVTCKLVSDVTGALRGLCQKRDDTRPNSWLDGDGPRVFACANGLLDLDQMTLRDHSPDYFALAAVPVAFDPAAPPPATFLRVLDEVMEGDGDRIAVIQEFFGVCLDPALPFKHFGVWTGRGNNGKTVILTVLRALLGEDNHAAVSLQQLSERFGTWPLFGKLANLVGDQGYIDSKDEGRLREMTGGDPVPFEQKGRDVINALNTAKMVFACNTVPTFADKSDALWNRLSVLPFEYVVPKEKQNPNYLRAEFWADELPGVLNWSLEGLTRYRRTGRLTQSLKCEAAVEKHRLDSNPAMAFLTDHYVDTINETDVVYFWKLYADYRAWAAQHGYTHLLTAPVFGKVVRTVFPYATQPDNPVKVPGPDGGRIKERPWHCLKERPDPAV